MRRIGTLRVRGQDGARMSARYLAVDLGAESGRLVLGRFDGGRMSLEEVHRFPNTPVRLPNGLHWDVLRFHSEIKDGLAKAMREEEIGGIGIDSWGVDFGLLDGEGALVSNPYHHRDTRTEGMIEEAFGLVPKEKIYQTTGIQFLPINTLYQLLAMQGPLRGDGSSFPHPRAHCPASHRTRSSAPRGGGRSWCRATCIRSRLPRHSLGRSSGARRGRGLRLHLQWNVVTRWCRDTRAGGNTGSDGGELYQRGGFRGEHTPVEERDGALDPPGMPQAMGEGRPRVLIRGVGPSRRRRAARRSTRRPRPSRVPGARRHGLAHPALLRGDGTETARGARCGGAVRLREPGAQVQARHRASGEPGRPGPRDDQRSWWRISELAPLPAYRRRHATSGAGRAGRGYGAREPHGPGLRPRSPGFAGGDERGRAPLCGGARI